MDLQILSWTQQRCDDDEDDSHDYGDNELQHHYIVDETLMELLDEINATI